jgi:adenine-specific DNA-methyltransferase
MADLTELDTSDPETRSADIVAGNVAALKSLFPEAVTEGKIDFQVLKDLLGGALDERDEKYGLNWHGKRRARQIALTPSTGTLLPCPGDSVEWENTQNVMIEGDNPEVLKLLQKSYAGKVKLIYIDPPYNTGKDFVYPDDFRDNIKNYLELTDQLEGGKKISSNTDASGRFHTDWLNMMYPRLKLARALLRNDGVIFISIDDHECNNLRTICNEIFGEENFRANVVWRRTVSGAISGRGFVVAHDHILVYSRSPETEFERLPVEDETDYKNPDNDTRGPYKLQKLERTLEGARPSMTFAIMTPNGPTTKTWAVSPQRYQELVADNRIAFSRSGQPYYKQFLAEYKGRMPDTWWDELGGNNQSATRELKALMGEDLFNNPKPVDLVRVIQMIGCDSAGIVLDFFSGSGTTAHAVISQNSVDGGTRRFIVVQLPEPLDSESKEQKVAADFCDRIGKPKNIAELTKDRIRRSAKAIKAANSLFGGDTGFRVFKLASSNIRAWEPDIADIEGSLLKNAEHLVPGRSEEDVLFELLLKLGLDLCVPIETKIIAGKTVHSIGRGALIACLADGVTREVIEPLSGGIVRWRKELAPAVDTRVVFKDSGFADDITKTNMAAILNQNGISDVRSL